MKLVILAGGYGTRISEETKKKTKTSYKNWNQAYNLAFNENLFKI